MYEGDDAPMSGCLGPKSVRAVWLPLCGRQSLLWADDQLLSESRRHFWLLCIELDGKVDPAWFEQVWNQTALEHDALSLVIDKKNPRQRMAKGLPELVHAVLPQGVSLERWLSEQATKPFASGRQPWEAILVSIPGGGCAFLFRSHAAVCDERSFELVVSEVNARYLRQPVAAAEQFRQEILRQTAPLRNAQEERARVAWAEKLSQPPPVALPLPSGGTRSALGILRCERLYSAELVGLIEAIQLEGVSIPGSREQAHGLCLEAAVLAWLHLMTEQREVVIAVPLDHRTSPSSRAVGPFTDVYYSRVEVDRDVTYVELIRRVLASREFIIENSHLSIGDPGCSSAYVGPYPSLPSTFCGHPVRCRFGSASLFTNSGLGEDVEFRQLSFRRLDAVGRCGVAVDFAKAHYSQEAAQRLTECFVAYLSQWLREPARRIGAAHWLLDSERETLLRIGRGRTTEQAPDLLERFEHFVGSTPEHVAVEFHEGGLSYRKLDELTNVLARQLRALGVTRESRVAVAMPRGFGEIVALLATLKAEGAYVPIDPTHPIDRVRVILEDAAPEVLIAPGDSSLAAAIPQGSTFLPLSESLASLAGNNEPFVLRQADHEGQLAYILFTSGSTGRPKGVEIPRGAFANFLQSMAHEPGLRATDRVLAITTTTFDIAGLELFLPLYVGGTVVIADKATATDPVQLGAFIAKNRISVMQATPATYRLLLEAGFVGNKQLRMLCGGEAMSQSLACRLASCGAELWNVYGPTETTVWSTIERISKGVSRVTIGHPIDNTTIELRDSEGRRVPLGAIGEICIGGLGLARGYCGRDDLTAERFCYDAETHARYYRTGDLGRYLEDHRLECLGRVDHQIKIRGFRIEPADIESQLRSLPDVKEVLVVAASKGEEDPVLVAYWVGSATADALRAAAVSHLPHYMVPSAFVQLDAFPLSTTGKIDRKRLPSPELARTQLVDVGGIAPRDDQETMIAALFRQALSLDYVPVDRDFFSLGGTSVKAIALRQRIADTLGIHLPLQVLFNNPTVEAIAKQLHAQPGEEEPLVSWLTEPNAQPPWIGLMGIRLFDDVAQAFAADASFLAIHVPIQYVPGHEPFPSVVAIAKKYVDVIREKQPKGPYFLLGLCHGGVVAFEAAVQLERLGETVAIVGLLDAELPAARRVRRGDQMLGFARRALTEPRVFKEKLYLAWKQARGKVTTRLPRERFDSLSPVPIELPTVGAEVDRSIADYERLSHRTNANVLSFRATKTDVCDWVEIQPDLGWKGRSEVLKCHDLPCSHLGILRDEFARDVASILGAARVAIEQPEVSQISGVNNVGLDSEKKASFRALGA